MAGGEFVNAAGDLVSWEALDEAEQAYHSTPTPWVVSEYGLSLLEYVCWYWNEAALAEFYFEHPEYVPDVP